MSFFTADSILGILVPIIAVTSVCVSPFFTTKKFSPFEGTNYAIDRDNCYCKLGNLCYERAKELFTALKQDGRM